MVADSFSGTVLRFRVLRVPVRVETAFVITTLILGQSRLSSAESFLSWLAVVFVSVLVHELGHALVGRRFGLEPDIRLYGWGGLTSFTSGVAPSRPRELAIALAGPGVGIVFGVACWLAAGAVPPDAFWLRLVLDDFVWASAIWGAVNLLPILPLDGGQAFEVVLGMIAPGRAEQGARLMSAVTGLGAGALAVQHGYTITGIFAGWLGISSAHRFVTAWKVARDEDLIAQHAPVFSSAIEAGDGAAVTRAAEEALPKARTDRGRSWIAENLAVGRVLTGSLDAAVAALALAPRKLPASVAVEAFVVSRVVAQRKSKLAVEAGAVPQVVEEGTSRATGRTGVWARASEALRATTELELDSMQFAFVREAAEILGRDGDAARLGEPLLKRSPDPDLAFVLACAWARAGHTKRAEELAQQASALGFRDRERVARAPELLRRAFERAWNAD